MPFCMFWVPFATEVKRKKFSSRTADIIAASTKGASFTFRTVLWKADKRGCESTCVLMRKP